MENFYLKTEYSILYKSFVDIINNFNGKEMHVNSYPITFSGL